MSSLLTVSRRLHEALNSSRRLDFIAPLLLRLFLAPVFLSAGLNKALAFDSTVAWFGNAEWGLGLPLPWLMALLATATELLGGILLLLGLATRYIAVPLMVTMWVAAVTVHLDNGWYAIAPSDPATSMSQPLAAIGVPGADASLENSREVAKRLGAARELLQAHGHYGWLTETGPFVVLNNGIEFAATYFIMLLSLFFSGGGRYLSVDYYLARRFAEQRSATA